MNFSTLVFFSAITAATAANHELSIDSEISASSPIGRSLLSKARSLEGAENFGWVSNYSIKFEKCATSTDYYASQYFGGNGQNGNGQNNGENRNGFGGMYEQRLVHFKLCPSDSCGSCSKGGDYVIDLNEFVEAVVQSKLSAQEYDCEQQRQRCEYSCQNANDDETCQYQCLMNGSAYCQDNQGGNNNNRNGNYQQQFNLEEAVNCKRLDVDKDALQYYMYNNGGNRQYQFYGNGEIGLYVGPYCTTNGKKIMLGVFMDQTCSYPADKQIVNRFGLSNYLPYQTESLVDSGCISCKEPSDYNEQNYNDQQDADDVTEVCERLYEESGKCETNLASTYYPNTYGCQFIKSLKASGTRMRNKSLAIPAKVFATLFAATTVIFGGVAYHLHQRVQRTDVSLTADENGQLA